MKIQFLKQHGRFQPGWVIGTTEKEGAELVEQGIARQVADHTRSLKYTLAQELSYECVQETPDDDALIPKDAITPSVRFPRRPKD